ncbi:MAG: zinc ribbon domain-containing protein [Anaerolineales bacterium]|nr:zinc ribbon domain-containing protein [Anaerolineales bacterium]
MPIYEYQCPSCGEIFDKLMRFSEADQVPVCPHCGEKETQKKITAGAVIGASSGGRNSSVSSAPAPRFT